MTGPQLQQTDLLIGDILLFEDVTGAATHFGIAALQVVVSHRKHASSNVTHAGLYDGGGRIQEAAGAAGLRSMALVEKHKGSKYQVYRYATPRLPLHASSWAEKLIAHRPESYKNPEFKGVGFGRYDTPMAAGGIFSRSNRGEGAENAVEGLIANPFADRGFYCSNFVVECYELARHALHHKPVIDVDYRKVSPKVLQANLRKSPEWTYKGNYIV
jgi:cell wall-associated NlpC family hydrolase